MTADGPRYPQYPGEQPDLAPPATQAAARYPAPPAGERADGDPVQARLAGWWVRVGASLLDGLILLAVSVVPLVAGFTLLFAGASLDEATGAVSDLNPAGWVVLGIAGVLYVGFDVWNRGLRVGRRGQSLGKQVLGLHVLRAGAGVPTGALEGFFRWLVALLLQWTCLGYVLDLLWPLWDDKNQTLHDKAIGTVVVRRH